MTPNHGGVGLGLAIARRIPRQHNGDLIREAASSGASFALQIPAPRPGPNWTDLPRGPGSEPTQPTVT